MSELLRLVEYPVAVRVSLALVHFLWQGLALAAVALALQLALRRASASVRVSGAARGARGDGGLPADHVRESWATRSPRAACSPSAAPPMPAPALPRPRLRLPCPCPLLAPALRDPSGPAPAASSALPVRVWRRLQPRLPWISLVWMLGVVLLSLRFLFRGWAVARLGRRLREAEARWQELLVTVASQIRLRRPVRLVTSLAAHTPDGHRVAAASGGLADDGADRAYA